MGELPKITNCPFCGGSASVERSTIYGVFYSVRCADTACYGHSPYHQEPSAAIAAWNRRTPAPIDTGKETVA